MPTPPPPPPPLPNPGYAPGSGYGMPTSLFLCKCALCIWVCCCVSYSRMGEGVWVCGDYNIDLLKVKTNKHNGEHFDEIISQGFIPKSTLPTRISEHSSTLIDNIFTSNMDEKESSGILLNQISDHQMIFTLIINNCNTCTKICRDPE